MNRLDKPPVAAKRKFNWGLWTILGCGGTLLLCCGGGVFGTLQIVDYPLVARRGDSTLHKYEKEGLPWEAKDLKTDLPDEKNGAIEVRAAISAFDDNVVELEKSVATNVKGGKFDPASATLNKYGKGVNLMLAAGEKEGFDFGYDWDLGARLLFPELVKLKSGARLLNYRAFLAARTGNLDSALRDLRASYQIGNMSMRLPSLIPMLTGISIQNSSNEMTLRVAALRKGDANWVGRVRREVEGWKSQVDFNRAMEGEAYMGVATLRNVVGDLSTFASEMASGESSGEETMTSDAELVRTGYPDEMMKKASLIRWMETQVYLRKEFNKPGVNKAMIGKDFDFYTENILGSPPKLSYAFNVLMLPPFAQGTMAAASSPFKLGAAVGVLKAAEAKARTGKYPSKFSDLGIDLDDPAIGGVAWYKIGGETVSIYSVGLNEVNDGGLRDSETGADDVTITFPPTSWR